MRPLPGLRPVLFLLFLCLCPALLHAQASAAASRNFSVDAFTGVSIVNTDRGQTNPGFTFGAGVGYYIGKGFIPAIEGRIKLAPGTPYGENTYGGGIHIPYHLRHANIYANFLCSYGTITIPNSPTTTTNDNSVVYSPGGGVDLLLSERFGARIDYQYEYWHTGTGVSFNPQAFTFGIVYRFPLRPYVSH